MSSILKALQRLQGDRGTGGSPAPKPALQDQFARDLAAPPLVAPAPAPPEAETPPSRARLAILAVPIAAALVTVALAGWWLASGSDDETEAPIAAAASEPPAVAAEPASPQRTATRRPAPMAPPPVARAPAPAAAPPPPAPRPAEAAALASDPDPDPSRRPRVAPLRRRTTGDEPPRFQVVAQAGQEAEPEAAEAAPPPPSEDPDQRPGAASAKNPAQGAAAGTVRPADLPKREAKPAPAAKPAKAPAAPLKKAAAKPPAKPPAASDGVVVLRTVWHPKPERRVARIQLPGMDEPVEVHEGDSVRSYLVKAIEPSGVLLDHGGRELRRSVGSGSDASGD